MPGNNYLPDVWLSSGQQVDHFQGEVLLNINNTDVSAPASWPVFADIRMLLNSRCAFADGTSTFSTLVRTTFGLPGDFIVALDAQDRVTFSNTSAFSVEGFSANNPLGFAASTTYTSSPVGAVHHVVAPADWTRGAVDASELGFTYNVINPAAATNCSLKTHEGKYSSLPELLQAASDIADASARSTDNLSKLVDTALGGTNGVRFHLDDEGKVVWSILASYGTPSLSSSFLSWLGFNGTESWVACVAIGATAWKQATATELPTGLLKLGRPLDMFEPNVMCEVAEVVLSDGHIERSHIYTIVGRELSFTLRGQGSRSPTMMRAVRHFFNFLCKTPHFTVYLDSKEVRAAVAVDQDYSTENTPEWDMQVGFHRLVVAPGYSGQQLTLLTGNTRKLYAPVSLSCFPYVR